MAPELVVPLGWLNKASRRTNQRCLLLRLEDHLLNPPSQRTDFALGTGTVIAALSPVFLGTLIRRERSQVLDQWQQLSLLRC